MGTKLLKDETVRLLYQELARHNNNVENIQGSLADLQTVSKLNLVSAVNELKANIGALGSLATTEKGSLVAAINEITGKSIFDWLDEYTDGGAGLHNSIYRGKNLGTSVTSEQWAQISAGTFKDLYIGDYWEITVSGKTYRFRIADFDYWCNLYDNKLNGESYLKKHHVVIVPDTQMYMAIMNDSNTTEGGYYGSKMHSTNLETAKSTINSAFGSGHILTHRLYLTNAITNGRPSGSSSYDCTVELMSEQMVYGARIVGAGTDPTGSSFSGFNTYDRGQLNLFKHRHDLIAFGNGDYYWLRDVVSASHFVCIANNGSAYGLGASASSGVRPDFAICGSQIS